jgi:hypothetical protein
MTADPQDRRELVERLLPCPFCGGEPSTSSAGGHIWCPRHTTSMSRTEWNWRKPSEGREVPRTCDGWLDDDEE